MEKEKLFKISDKMLIIIIVMSFLALFFLSEGIIYKIRKPREVPMDFVLSTEEGDYCEIYVNGIESFAEKGSEVMYFATDDDYFIYVVEISDSEFKKMEKAYKQDGYLQYNIRGYSKKIPSDVLSLAIESFSEIFGLDADREVFDTYVGDLYLDCVNTPYADKAAMFFVFAGFSAMFLLVLLIIFFSNKKQLKNIKKNFNEDVLYEQMNAPETVFFKKYGLYLCPDYLITVNSLTKNISSAAKYDDIAMMYFTNHKMYGLITTARSLNVFLNNYKQFTIPGFPAKDKKGEADQIINSIISKNENIMIGYTKENLDRYKEICENKRNSIENKQEEVKNEISE